MSRAESGSRLRGTTLRLAALALLTIALPLLALGIVLTVAGLLSWLHPVDVASAWARTLAGAGLIGGGACFGALGWLVMRRLRRGAALREAESALDRRLVFVAVLGILLALVCLPFGAAIRAGAHGAGLGWGPEPGARGWRIIPGTGGTAPRLPRSSGLIHPSPKGKP